MIEESPLDFRQTAILMHKLAEALDYAHEQGIVHRDVKPANIMVDAKAEPMLMDFGLARIQEAADRMTHDEAVLGTPAYMSPEQAAAKQDEIGPASDQYSLGIVLYKLLTGELPFAGPPSLVISLVQSEDPTPPRQHNAKIPKDLETICLKTMTKETSRRYPTCQELADDLRRWVDNVPITARRVTIKERLWRWCRRNPKLAVSSALVGSVLASGLILSSRAILAERASLAAQREAESAYNHQIALASRIFTDDRDAESMNYLLTRCPERLRRWEWHFLWHLGHFTKTLNGVKEWAISPDESLLATTYEDNTIRLNKMSGFTEVVRFSSRANETWHA